MCIGKMFLSVNLRKSAQATLSWPSDRQFMLPQIRLLPVMQMLLASCQQEVQEVVSLCTNSSYTSLLFVVHSFEVLKALPAAARVIARPLPHMGCDQAESFLLNYVEVLAGGASTWALAADYLAWCPVYGADALEALLDKSPVSEAWLMCWYGLEFHAAVKCCHNQACALPNEDLLPMMYRRRYVVL